MSKNNYKNTQTKRKTKSKRVLNDNCEFVKPNLPGSYIEYDHENPYVSISPRTEPVLYNDGAVRYQKISVSEKYCQFNVPMIISSCKYSNYDDQKIDRRTVILIVNCIINSEKYAAFRDFITLIDNIELECMKYEYAISEGIKDHNVVDDDDDDFKEFMIENFTGKPPRRSGNKKAPIRKQKNSSTIKRGTYKGKQTISLILSIPFTYDAETEDTTTSINFEMARSNKDPNITYNNITEKFKPGTRIVVDMNIPDYKWVGIQNRYYLTKRVKTIYIRSFGKVKKIDKREFNTFFEDDDSSEEFEDSQNENEDEDGSNSDNSVDVEPELNTDLSENENDDED